MSVQAHATAEVALDATIGARTRIWGLAQVREAAVVGEDCVLGRGAYLGAGVRVGDNVKVQNFAQIYEPAVIDDGVFIGPAAVLTNDEFPRAISPDGKPKGPADWTPVGVKVREGASIGARAVCVAPVTIGRWAMVGAGSTVVHDVQDFALVVGTPARFLTWVGPAGRPLKALGDGHWECPLTGALFRETSHGLQEV
jgi:serine acetyltransferase